MTDISAALGPAKKAKTAQNQPLGLFGGRFDPVHRAHIKIAEAVADQLGLPEVRWIVTGDPVHKPAVASSHHRLAMVQLALEALDDPRMSADDREIRSALKTGRPSYTADTIAELKQEAPGRPLTWILGEDQLQDFQTWHQWEWLVKNMALAVCARTESASSETIQRIKDMGGNIHWISFEPDNVSSTQVRHAIAEHQPLGDSLPGSVMQYIQKNRLYL